MLNPSNSSRYVYDKETNSRHISGLIRRKEDDTKLYGEQMQENAINLLAELAIRGEYTADAIITGKVDISEFNSYKKADDLVKLLAVSMRNDYDKEMSFEELVNNKIDSFIEHSDGTKEPANTFFYGILNDSSIVENEFDKYMGKGARKDLDTPIQQLHEGNMSQARFDNIFKTAQELISEFANVRMQEKYKEARLRNGQNIPSLDNKIKMINEMTGIEQEQQQTTTRDNSIQLPEGYSINEFGEIIRPAIEENGQQRQTQSQVQPQVKTVEKLSLKQRVAQFLQKNNLFMNLSFVDKFVHRQLDVLPPATQEVRRTATVDRTRESFINILTNNGEYRNLPPVQRMSDPERMAQMRRKMEQNQHANENNGRELDG